MPLKFKKYMVVILIALFGFGAVANAASGITACPPTRCCCTTAPVAMPVAMPATMMDHGGDMEMPQSCAPQEAAPCCKLESDPLPIDLAISAAPNFGLYRISTAHDVANIIIDAPVIPTRIISYLEDGPPKIPLVPIYLQTLSIRC